MDVKQWGLWYCWYNLTLTWHELSFNFLCLSSFFLHLTVMDDNSLIIKWFVMTCRVTLFMYIYCLTLLHYWNRCGVDGCSKSYFTPNSLTSHMRSHHKEEELRCQWAGCGKKFDKPCRLKAHMRVHTGQRPFICTYEVDPEYFFPIVFHCTFLLWVPEQTGIFLLCYWL